MRLLSGMESRVVREKERKNKTEDGKENLKEEEIRGSSRKLKDGKAARVHKIPREVWIYER